MPGRKDKKEGGMAQKEMETEREIREGRGKKRRERER